MASSLETIKFVKLPDAEKKLFLLLLGYEVDEEGFITLNGKRHLCPYSNEYVDFKSASILPGSTVIIKTSPYTLSCYISDHLEGEVSSDEH